MTSALPAQPPTGWYPDPGGTGHERFWDGSSWTLYMRVPGAPGAGPQFAHWTWRVLAALIDGVVLFVLTALTQALWPWPGSKIINDALDMTYAQLAQGVPFIVWQYPGFIGAWLINIVLGAAIAVAYHTFFTTRWGASVGKLALGLRIVPMDDLNAPRLDLRTALTRSASYEVISVVPVFNIVNWLSPLWRVRRQAFHDSLAKTVVLKIS